MLHGGGVELFTILLFFFGIESEFVRLILLNRY